MKNNDQYSNSDQNFKHNNFNDESQEIISVPEVLDPILAEPQPIDVSKAARQGGIWSFVTYLFSKFIGLLSSIVLARLLLPEHFGLIAMVNTVLGFIQIIGVWGVGYTIIYEQDDNRERVNTGWWLDLFIGISLFIISNLLAPLAVVYYKNPMIGILIFVASVNFIINPIGDMMGVLLRRDLKFKLLTKIEMTGYIAGSLSTIILAFCGAGVWSFIYPGIITSITLVICKWRFSDFRPKLKIDWSYSRKFLNFGKYLFGSNISSYINDNIGYILIGGLIGGKQLGLYMFAFNLGTWIVQNISGFIAGVLFPTVAASQNDHVKAKSIFLRIIQVISILGFPLAALQFAIAPLYIVSIYGDKWQPCVITFKIIVLFGVVKAVFYPAVYLISAMGRPDVGFKISISGLPFLVAAVYIGSSYGINGVALATTLIHGIIVFFYIYIPFRVLKWDMKNVYITLFPAFISSVIAGVLTAALFNFVKVPHNSLAAFFTLAGTGALIYFMFMYIFFNHIVTDVIKLIKTSVVEAKNDS